MKLKLKTILYASLPFGWITIFWYGYDQLIQAINIQTFGLSSTVSGAILAIDNVLGLFLLPLFGMLSDKTNSKIGKRTPYVLAGTAVALTAFVFVGVFASEKKLALYIIALIISLIAMASYRSPALAMVPDVTPEPLRSKANATTNLVSAAFNLVAIAIVTPFLTTKYIAASNYYPVVLGLVAASLATVIVFCCVYRENKALAVYKSDLEDLRLFQEEIARGEAEAPKTMEVSTEEKSARNKFLCLAAVFFFYMAYNALVSNLTNYSTFVLELKTLTVPIIVTMAGAIIGFLPAVKITEKFGRKTVIFIGFLFMLFALSMLAVFTLAFSELSTAILVFIYVCFGFAGFGYGFIMVNIYPLFIEYSDDSKIGSRTGVYAAVMTVAMVITPILAGVVIDGFGKLFGTTYTTAAGDVYTGDYKMLIPYCILNIVFALVATALMKSGKRAKNAPPSDGALPDATEQETEAAEVVTEAASEDSPK